MADTEQGPAAPDPAAEPPASADLPKQAQGKPGDPNTGAAAGGGKLAGADASGGQEDDMGRGAD